MPSLVAVDLRAKRVSRSPAPAAAELYTEVSTDTLYVVSGTTVKPQFTGALTTGLWFSGTIVRDDQPTFAWARVEGPSTNTVLRIYGDGALFYTTPTITTNNPVRLPAARFREWSVEVESNMRITDVVLASSAAELAAA